MLVPGSTQTSAPATELTTERHVQALPTRKANDALVQEVIHHA